MRCSVSVSRLTLFDRGGHLVHRGRDLVGGGGHVLGHAVTLWIDAVVSLDGRGCLASRAVASDCGVAVTCSIEAAISLTDDASSSADAAIDSACAGRLAQRRRHLG